MNKFITVLFDVLTIVPCTVIALLDYNNGKGFASNLKDIQAKHVEVSKNPTQKPKKKSVAKIFICPGISFLIVYAHVLYQHQVLY